MIASESESWPGFRGPNRDGIAPRLPARLPKTLKIAWSRALTSRGLAGIAATPRYVIVADRNPTDTGDVIRCLDADTGRDVWQHGYATFGQIKDYGNVPRATPLIYGELIYALGGLGDLCCLRLSSGKVAWSKHLARDFGARVPTWGYCSSPLAVEGKLIVNPGARQAALVALDCESGKEIWRSPGLPSAYASFIFGRFGGVRQVIGYDEKSLGGWDVASGKRLWTLVPPAAGDFNVPTPIGADGTLIAVSENNGARRYQFGPDGRIKSEPLAVNGDLAPDSSSPVIAGHRLFGCSGSLYCLDLRTKLEADWVGEDDEFASFASLIASADRILIATLHGELLLVDANAGKLSIVSRLRVFPKDSEVHSHPAIVGSRIYLRDMERIVCVDLEAD